MGKPESSSEAIEVLSELRGLEAGSVAPSQHAAIVWPRRHGLWRDALLRRMLALADALAVLLVSLALATVASDVHAGVWAALFLPVWLVLAKTHGLYDRDHRSLRHLTVDELPSILSWSLTGTAAVMVLLLFTPADSLETGVAVWMWIVAAGSAFFLRSVARMAWRRITAPERVLIVGTGPLAAATRRKLELFPDIHAEIIGQQESFDVGDLQSPPDWLRDLDRLILASNVIDEEVIAALVGFCRRYKIKLSVIPPARGAFGTAVQLNHIADLPVVEYNTWDVSRSTMLLKRTLDLVAATTALLLLAPLFLLVALAIRLETPGSPIFVQRRAGRNGRPFRMYKFRTMVADAERRLSEVVSLDELRDPMFKLEHDPRVTRVGRFLRRTSLDELPQLFNVLRGEMSLVGPRPEQLELTDRYRPEHQFRLDLKPGLTGPMQVFGRGRLSFDERLAVERDYIENLSLGRDLRILALTVSAVVNGKGAF